jgi:Arm DNA-binding domain
MNKIPDEITTLRSWLRKRPSVRNDSRFKLDPYWRMRALGFSHSYAKLVLRTEPILVVPLTPLDPVKIAEEYGVNPDDILIQIGPDELHRQKQVEIAIRPETLTEQVVTEAGPLGYEYSIKEGRVPGLVLRIRSSGHKSYVLYYRVDGCTKTRKIRIATAGAVTLEMARDMARRHLMVARMGKDPAVWRFNEIRRRLEKRCDDEDSQ